MTEELKKQLDEFRARTARFAAGELSVKEYKGFSGKFGSYAQKGAKASMLRLRMAGGHLTKERMKAILDLCAKYEIQKMHCTTCQTIQLHDISLSDIADVLTDAIESGFYTLGGGGDFPRNVMVSPLSGVEKGENFDVYPYAEKAAAYLLTQIDAVKMPRKLKVCFSNSPANEVHATFRDMGFVSRPDGTFDVYCAGGMGSNPRMGVKVGEGVDGTQLLYYIRAMIDFFCRYGNYENRAKARTRYIQEVLGDRFVPEFHAALHASLSQGGLTIEPEFKEITKKGSPVSISSPRIAEQKQPGLYTVKFHPIGGLLTPDTLNRLYEAILPLPEVSVRIAPDETLYIINVSGDEVPAVLEASMGGAKKAIEESVACIGASVCQQGLRDSQALLKAILAAVEPYDFPADALPVIHISGCVSSCGTHQIGSIGFHGKSKTVNQKPVPGFAVTVNGCDRQGIERFGDDLGVMAFDDIPVFFTELGQAVTAAGVSYQEYARTHSGELTALIRKYC